MSPLDKAHNSPISTYPEGQKRTQDDPPERPPEQEPTEATTPIVLVLGHEHRERREGRAERRAAEKRKRTKSEQRERESGRGTRGRSETQKGAKQEGGSGRDQEREQ